jgi:hypothetical protein
LEYLRFQTGHHPQPAAATINRRVGVVERALRNEFPDTVSPIAPGFNQVYWRRPPLGYGRPHPALSRLRVKEPKRIMMPLSVDDVSRFWSSFRTSRDLAIVGLMLLQGLRSIIGLVFPPKTKTRTDCYRHGQDTCGKRAS